MKILLNSTRTEATIEYLDGHTHTVSCDLGVLDVLSLWCQPIEEWDGKFLTIQEFKTAKETTVSLKVA